MRIDYKNVRRNAQGGRHFIRVYKAIMGSRSEKKQPGALVGEKSQTVFSANWKLDVMLLKNLQMLDVSKHRVSHRISMDQRVVNKRFQTRLHRSRITHARMTNNQELLRELIHRDNYTFNSSVGGQDEKYNVKISPTQETPDHEENGTIKETLTYGNGKGIRPAATPIVVLEPNADAIQGTSAGHVKPGKVSVSGSKLPSNSVSIARKDVTRRPATGTATVVSIKQNSQATPQVETGLSADKTSSDDRIVNSSPVHQTQPKVIIADRRKLRPNTAVPALSKTKRATQLRRPKTAAARQDSQLLTTLPPDGQNSSQTRPTSAARQRPFSATQRPGSEVPRRRTPPSKQKHAMPSIFGEDKLPTLMDVNTERLMRANFPDRVKNFTGTLNGLQTDPDQTVDYYTHRLLENLQSAGRKGPREFIESDAERRDAQRSIGNLSALNMTFGKVERVDPGDHLASQCDGVPVKARLRAWGSDDDGDDNDDDG